jgi:hypothetical protein
VNKISQLLGFTYFANTHNNPLQVRKSMYANATMLSFYDVEIDTDRPEENQHVDPRRRRQRAMQSDAIDNQLSLSFNHDAENNGRESDSDSENYNVSESSHAGSYSTDEEVSVLYSMRSRPYTRLKQVGEVALTDDDDQINISTEDGIESSTLFIEHYIGDDPEEATVGNYKANSLSTRTKVMVVILVVVLVLTIVLSVLLGKHVSQTRESVPEDNLQGQLTQGEELEPNTEQPSIFVVDIIPDDMTTSEPSPLGTTKYPTMSPTSIPTYYPTTADQNTWTYLLSVLGEYTRREYLLDASRPQGRAFLQLMMDNSGSYDSLSRTQALQNFSILTLYYSTSPKTWDSYYHFTEQQKSDVCSWNGIVSCYENNIGEQIVQGISVNNIGIEGSIPTEVCLLEDLERLELRSNKLTGEIPQCLVGSSSIKVILLDNNYLTGYLPNGMLLVPTLEEFEVTSNQLIGDLAVLVEGTFVKNVYRYGETWRMRRLGLANNLFTGDIPGFLGALGNLKSLTLHSNKLVGEVDEMLCDRTRSELEELTADCQEVMCSCCTACY